MKIIDNEIKTKLCIICHEVKPLDGFYKGVNVCKQCKCKQRRVHRIKLYNETHKTCRICGETKLITEFPNRTLYCKTCSNLQKRTVARQLPYEVLKDPVYIKMMTKEIIPIAADAGEEQKKLYNFMEIFNHNINPFLYMNSLYREKKINTKSVELIITKVKKIIERLEE